MAVRIGSNISSIQAQRRLSEGLSTLSRTYERLSSGQRINRASDDAAGLAIADALRVNSRIGTQGVRNLNDTISYYSIVEGATKELKNIIFRAKELSEQSANGVYTAKQRAALDSELQSLGQEYNRILAGTSFNGRKVFDRNGSTLHSQAGDSILTTNLSAERAAFIDTISCLSLGSDGAEGSGNSSLANKPSLSSDGRYVVFTSTSANLVGVNGQQIYRADLQTGDIVLASSNAIGVAGSLPSTSASISADGRYVLFSSAAANLVSGVSGPQIYCKDLQCGEITLISSNSAGAAATGGWSYNPSMSWDGRYVVFNSDANNLGVNNGFTQVYRKDLETGQVEVISADATGQAGTGGPSAEGSLSRDARYVVFKSSATNLVPGVSGTQIYRKDLSTGTVTLVSSDSLGQAGTGSATAPALSADGRFAGFTSTATTLISGVAGTQVYLKDLQSGEIRLISCNSSGDAGLGGSSGKVSISGDGHYAVFNTAATNLVAGDGKAKADAFIKDMWSGDITRLSVSASGVEGLNGLIGSSFPQISDDGRHVAFVSDMTNLLDGTTTTLSRSHIYFSSNPFIDGSILTHFQWVNIRTQSEAKNTLTWLDSYLNELNTFQGDFGSSMSRLDIAKNVLSSMNENFSAAESRVRDADIADESATLAKTQILQRAASAVLAQANQAPSLAIELLR